MAAVSAHMPVHGARLQGRGGRLSEGSSGRCTSHIPTEESLTLRSLQCAALDEAQQRLLFFRPSPEPRRHVRLPAAALCALPRLTVRTDLQDCHCYVFARAAVAAALAAKPSLANVKQARARPRQPSRIACLLGGCELQNHALAGRALVTCQVPALFSVTTGVLRRATQERAHSYHASPCSCSNSVLHVHPAPSPRTCEPRSTTTPVLTLEPATICMSDAACAPTRAGPGPLPGAAPAHVAGLRRQRRRGAKPGGQLSAHGGERGCRRGGRQAAERQLREPGARGIRAPAAPARRQANFSCSWFHPVTREGNLCL